MAVKNSNNKLADKQVTARYVVIPDTHGKLIYKPAWWCVLKTIEIIKPTGIIHLGDIGEWESCNHHKHKRVRQPDPHETSKSIIQDVKDINRYILDPLDEVCYHAGVMEKHITQGNHDRWIDYFVEKNPDYEHTSIMDAKGYLFKDVLRWDERNWKVYQAGKLLKIGHLNYYHGHLYGGIHHAWQHLLKMGVNVIYGHWHDLQTAHITHADGPKGAYSVGCLKSFDPCDNEWLENRPVNWAHVCTIVDYYGKGMFSVHPMSIINGHMTLNGQVLNGNGKKI